MIHRDPNQVMCNEKKTADHWLAARRRVGVEAALKRLRIAEGATHRKAGWIAEARSHYFIKITNRFRMTDECRQTEGLAAQSHRPDTVHADTIISRLIFGDRTLSIQKCTRRTTTNRRNLNPARILSTSPPKIATQLHPPQTFATRASCSPIATSREPSFSVFSLIEAAFLTDDLKTPI
ncbi:MULTISPECIES: hypothetical protein [unclassified Burkholderia]|uniref:hypothetical protein n=1 Tax=unclassified Burkholderia TaxID=2613784 RepID=UPI00158877E3|nr:MULTISPECIES: hypothetical protein [unclassified Burkholderia]